METLTTTVKRYNIFTKKFSIKFKKVFKISLHHFLTIEKGFDVEKFKTFLGLKTTETLSKNVEKIAGSKAEKLISEILRVK